MKEIRVDSNMLIFCDRNSTDFSHLDKQILILDLKKS